MISLNTPTPATFAERNFTRLLNSAAGTFRRAQRSGKPAPAGRRSVLEQCFENGSALADGIAAALLLKAQTDETLQNALIRFGAYRNTAWTDAPLRFPQKTIAEIKTAVIRADIAEKNAEETS